MFEPKKFWPFLTGGGDTYYWLSGRYFLFGKVTMHDESCWGALRCKCKKVTKPEHWLLVLVETYFSMF